MDRLAQAKPLLDFISRFESGDDYDIVWGGISRRDHPPRPLTDMTVGQVLDWQDSIDRQYMSEAAGRYQIMEDTLRGLYRSASVSLSDQFNEATQDRLALALLERRGFASFLEGQMSVESFCNSLAKEWASLPVVTGAKKGMSYYGGDGLNKSHVGVDEFKAAVAACREDPHTPEQPSELETVRAERDRLREVLAQIRGMAEDAL